VDSVCNSARKRWTQRSRFTGIPRKPSQTPTNVAACEIAFGVKVQLHAVVVAQTPHEAARRRRESALVEEDEADDVDVRVVGNSVPLRRHDPLRGLPVHIRRQLAAGHKQVQRQRRGRRALPRRRVDDGDCDNPPRKIPYYHLRPIHFGH
jgi:hypothetical protein